MYAIKSKMVAQSNVSLNMTLTVATDMFVLYVINATRNDMFWNCSKNPVVTIEKKKLSSSLKNFKLVHTHTKREGVYSKTCRYFFPQPFFYVYLCH